MKTIKTYLKRFFSLHNIAPAATILYVLAAGINPKLLGETTIEHAILIAIGLLAVDAIVERTEILSNLEEKINFLTASSNKIEKHLQSTESPIFFDSQNTAEMVIRIANSKNISHVEFLSCGLTSRQQLIVSLLKQNIKVQAYAQDPNTSLDPDDIIRTYQSLRWISREAPHKLDNFTLYYHPDISTVRAIVMHEAGSNQKYVFTGWYTYSENNTKVDGSTNPEIYFPTGTIQGDHMFTWIHNIIAQNKAISRPANILEETRK